MNWNTVGLCAILLVAGTTSDSLHKQLPQYVTQRNVEVSGSSTQNYVVQLCNGCVYDKLNATVSLNFPFHAYEPTGGRNYLAVTVYSQRGKVIATNMPFPNVHQSEFSIPYLAAYGDLHIKVRTGPASSFVYTFTVSFPQPSSGFVDRQPQPCEPRWIVSDREHKRHQEYIRTVQVVTGDKPEILIPIFNIQKNGSVITDTPITYELNYCFPSDLPYNITVTLVGLGDVYGFTSYGCPHSYKDGTCDVETPYRCITGASINVFTIPILTAADNGPVRVLIYGDGRFGQPNVFRLAGTSYYKNG